MLSEPQISNELNQQAFSRSGFCHGCYKKQVKIDKLTEEIKSLKGRLNRLEKKAAWIENPHTPSSKEVFPTAQKNQEKKKAGARKGHPGKTRKPIDYNEIDRIQSIAMPDKCPDCGDKLTLRTYERRKVIDTVERRVENIVYEVTKGHCTNCHKNHKTPISVLPKLLLGNQLLTEILVLAYLDHIPVSKIPNIFNTRINPSTIFKNIHHLAKLLKPCFEVLKSDIRQAPYRHADETGWKTAGKSGFAWVFCSKDTAVFQFDSTRSASVVRAILGEQALPGYLTVDRYNGYNQVKCAIQYCYAHLLREVIALEKESPLNEAIQTFSVKFSHLLSEAMKLQQNQALDDLKYYESAKLLQQQIEYMVLNRSEHASVLRIQEIFRDNAGRLYHWVNDRQVCNHNNFAERILRGTVIARKTSYGSQTVKGRESRSILMSLIYTAHQRLGRDREKLTQWLKNTLDRLVAHQELKPKDYLPPIPDG
tara:strand:+ start:124 stop:1560 length:1437 start_codon:yes stop_codon:yes gene_type:complete